MPRPLPADPFTDLWCQWGGQGGESQQGFLCARCSRVFVYFLMTCLCHSLLSVGLHGRHPREPHTRSVQLLPVRMDESQKGFLGHRHRVCLPAVGFVRSNPASPSASSVDWTRDRECVQYLGVVFLGPSHARLRVLGKRMEGGCPLLPAMLIGSFLSTSLPDTARGPHSGS